VKPISWFCYRMDGNSATGKWFFFGAFKYASDQRKRMANHYDKNYAKTPDQLKGSNLDMRMLEIQLQRIINALQENKKL